MPDLHSKKLKIAMLCSSTLWAGTEKWSLRASEELARRGHDVTFIGRSTDLFQRREINSGTLRFVQLPFTNDMDIYSLLRLAAWLKRHSDVLIATRVRDYWIGGLAAKLAGIPELMRLGVERSPREDYWRDRLRYGTLPTRILVNAHSIRNILMQSSFIDPADVRVIYNGVEAPGPGPAEARTVVRKELGIHSGELFVIGAGRLAVEKRWHWVVEAVAELRERGIPLTTVVFGEGSERPNIEARIHELKVGQWVHFPGLTSETNRYFGAADIAVLTSKTEGLSNAMLEAMGRGVATIATAAGGAAELLVPDRDLVLVGNNDKHAFIERLAELCQNRTLRTQLGTQGLETVRSEFTWELMGQQLELLLYGMLGPQ
jgi:glycosyltransferase involved in cell wall biosynthesis